MANEAIVFINLGTPASAEVKDVRKYLKEFLSDPYVIDLPAIPRWLLVNTIIAPFRSPKSSRAYKSIWTEDGSPLLVISQNFLQKMNQHLFGSNKTAFLCMRYGEPSMERVFKEVGKGQYSKVTIFPLYPQYALSTTQTVMKKARELCSLLNTPQVEWVQPFYDQDYFTKSYGDIIRKFFENNKFDYILYSYHGIPERHISKIPGCEGCEFTDQCCEAPGERIHMCYRAQCASTTQRLRKASGTENIPFKMTFQSRLGSGWLTPFTDVAIGELAERGIKKLAVVCPAFVVDCLETLEEIEQEGHAEFVKAGGEELSLIPCLNDDEGWIKQLGDAILENRLTTMRQTYELA